MTAARRTGAIRVAAVIPALNEEESLPEVLESLRAAALPRIGTSSDGRDVALDRVLVVDNGSTDGTPRVARNAGALVVSEPRRGYGRACLRGLSRLQPDPPDIVVFLDADFSDDPARLPALVMPIADGQADFVIGSRLLGECEAGALLPQARYGNQVAVALIRLLFGFRYTDLGPFRALSYPALSGLTMRDETFGWTVEMQVKAVQAGLRVQEVSVPYRRRVGVSKITGTVSGTIRAGARIIATILKLRLLGPGFSDGRGPS